MPHCLCFAREVTDERELTVPVSKGLARLMKSLEGYPVALCLFASLLLAGGTLTRLAVPLMIAPGTAGGDLRMWQVIASLSAFVITSLPTAFIIRVLSGEKRWAYAVIAMEVILTAATWAATDSDHARMIRNKHPVEDVHEIQLSKEAQLGNHILQPTSSISLQYEARNASHHPLLQTDRSIRIGQHQILQPQHPINMSILNTLEDLLSEQIKDLHSAETQLIKALPAMSEAATTQRLSAAILTHLDVTRVHVDRLEKIAEIMGFDPKGKTCKAMKGLIEEGSETTREEGDGSIRDLAIIVAAQKVEHYEISGYGSARATAELLGLSDVVDLLQATLDEEGETDRTLTELAQNIADSLSERTDQTIVE